MSTSVVVSAVHDTWVGQAKPNTTHANTPKLWVSNVTSAIDFGLILFDLTMLATPGTVVTSAILTLYLASAPAASHTYSIQKYDAAWNASSVNFSNRPAVSGTTCSATVGASPAGTAVNIDITPLISAIASGTPNYGFRISSNDTAGGEAFWSVNAATLNPFLTLVTSTPPTAPTGLSPAGGAVSTLNPVFTWDPPADGDAVTGFQIQADPSGDWASPQMDTGSVASTVAEYDPSGNTDWTSTPMTSGEAMVWRVRQTDSGGTSAWSDPATFSYLTAPAVTITSPSGGHVGEAQPTFTWTVTGGTQTAFRVLVYEAISMQLVDDSGHIASNVGAWAMNATIDDATSYLLIVQVWDGADRIAGPGVPEYLSAQATFTFADSGSAAPVIVDATVTVAPPSVTLTFTESASVSTFTIYRDGKVHAAGLVPADLLVSGTTYAYTDTKVKATSTHTYQVRAVTTGASTLLSAEHSVDVIAPGVWLVDPDSEDWIVVNDALDSVDQWTQVDLSTLLSPLGGDKQILVTQGVYGLTGPVAGRLQDWSAYGVTCDQLYDRVQRMRGKPGHVFRLIAAQTSIPVVVQAMSASESSITFPTTGVSRRNVAFTFIQAGDFEKVRI